MYRPIQDFVQQIASDDLAKDISHNLDKVVVLYNLIGERSDVTICTDTVDGKLGFSVTVGEEDAVTLSNTLNNISYYTSYGRLIAIQAIPQSDDNISVLLTRKRKNNTVNAE